MLHIAEDNLETMTDTAKKDFTNTKDERAIIINSRFGDLSIDVSRAIYFPKGLYGFKEDLHFALTEFPVEGLEQFKLLQCLNDHSISFPVIASSFQNSFISENDMQECLETVEVDKDNFLMLFIASSNKKPDGSFEVSINTKAPIVMDVELKIAIQYIFTNNKYTVSHRISDSSN